MENFLIGKLLLVPGFIIGFALHEFAHALAADKLGDSTPRQQGRLTIEPWPHIDIFGFISLLLVGFGWAKPVQINPRNFRNPRRDDILVSIAGPLTNLVLAILFGVIIYGMFEFSIVQKVPQNVMGFILGMLYATIWINVLLFVFNLLPIPPLDGSHVVANLLPYEQAYRYMSLQVYSLFIFILLVLTNAFTFILLPPTKFIYGIILGVLGLPDYLNIT